MTIRNCLAKIIRARWYRVLAAAALCAVNLAAASAPGSLAALVRAYRESPTPAHLTAVEAFAGAHAKETSGALARLALGVTAYERGEYPDAIGRLQDLSSKLPLIADYTGYYLAAARVEANDFAGVTQDLAQVHSSVPSLFAGRAWLLEARALKAAQPAESIRLLRDHYRELPQPDGDLTLADSYQAAGELARAADFYQRIYYQYVSGDAATRAAAALVTLKDALGPAYPPPLPQQMLQRADRLMDSREYRQARSEYEALAGQLADLERDQARVRIGAADFLGGNTAAAYPYLRGLDLTQSEADAERLYYLEECARRLTDDDEISSALKRLAERYPRSPWRLKALLSAANRFLLANRPADFVPLYRAVYEDFPSSAAAPQSHWKIAFQAYLEKRNDASDLLREHLLRYPAHASAGSTLYFLGRIAEADSEWTSARAYYTRLDTSFPNTYYAVLARQRLSRPEIGSASAPAKAADFLAGLALPAAKPVPAEATSATAARIERSHLLRTAGLDDLADGELRFGARNGGQPALLGMEMAGSAEAAYQALRMMKSMTSDYLNLPLASAPRKYWELLFPIPYRESLQANARANELDPYLVAGLIRQESEFNPQALSRANAYGLTQVRPDTGRQYARRAGVTRFTNRLLFQPAANLKIGTIVLRSMLDQNGGNLEQTLASYNAGPHRVAEWLTWRTYSEPAEFVESIPFTETREYVQAVLRNADIYRRLYR
ncbi:MAG: hypothetical protein C5B51_15880 [Terriglobia bacterium]|nr:MAG: hypothetical protein C5B51_15880 [Terriglobia bacterium]